MSTAPVPPNSRTVESILNLMFRRMGSGLCMYQPAVQMAAYGVFRSMVANRSDWRISQGSGPGYLPIANGSLVNTGSAEKSLNWRSFQSKEARQQNCLICPRSQTFVTG